MLAVLITRGMYHVSCTMYNYYVFLEILLYCTYHRYPIYIIQGVSLASWVMYTLEDVYEGFKLHFAMLV